MSIFKVYSHEKLNPESDMYLICECETKESAKYVVDALEYRDTGGRCDKSGLYDYYIKKYN